jgi:hypothetical protein
LSGGGLDRLNFWFVREEVQHERLTLVLVATVMAVVAGPTGGSQAVSPGSIHYPDLRTRAPGDLRIRWEDVKKLLRFSNTIYNWGNGPLELRPKNKPRGTTDAYQRLYSHDGNGTPNLVEEKLVGTFVFHRAHHHWHFEGFALYELLNDSGGSIGSLIKASKKTTVCIRDNAAAESGGDSLEHFGWGAYSRCDKAATEGLSVGYGDTYPWNIDGQSLDITGLADGCYWLRSTADPDGRLVESNNDNNTGVVRFKVNGDSIEAC